MSRGGGVVGRKAVWNANDWRYKIGLRQVRGENYGGYLVMSYYPHGFEESGHIQENHARQPVLD
jgi:hypothetical protein